MIRRCMFFHILKLRLHKPGDVKPCAYLYFLCCDLCIIILFRYISIHFGFVIYTRCRGIINETIQRPFAGMESALANLYISLMLVRFAFLELEASARHVFVEPFVCLHNQPPIIYVFCFSVHSRLRYKKV